MSGTSSAFTGWTWDEARQGYFYYSNQERCYIYQNGTRIAADPPANTARENKSKPQRDEPRAKATAEKAARDAINRGYGGGDTESDESDEGRLAKTFKGMKIKDKSKDSKRRDDKRKDEKRREDKKKDSRRKDGRRRDERRRDDKSKEPEQAYTTGPVETVTDPELLKVGVRAQGLLSGGSVPRYPQKLHQEYVRPKSGRKFFIKGRVFKTLWPESLGDSNSSVTVTVEKRFGEEIATKIRWFIVVKESDYFCTCLPIVTYNRQGVAKPNVKKSTHAIAFSSAEEPLPELNEYPRAGEHPMLPGIQIRPNKREDKLDPMARIDFARMYTVEHKIKAYYFGDVARQHLERLTQQWLLMISEKLTGSLATDVNTLRSRRAPRGHGSDDDDSEDDDDDDQDDSDDDDDDSDDDDDDPRRPPRNDGRGGGGGGGGGGAAAQGQYGYAQPPNYPTYGTGPAYPAGGYSAGGSAHQYQGGYAPGAYSAPQYPPNPYGPQYPPGN